MEIQYNTQTRQFAIATPIRKTSTVNKTPTVKIGAKAANQKPSYMVLYRDVATNSAKKANIKSASSIAAISTLKDRLRTAKVAPGSRRQIPSMVKAFQLPRDAKQCLSYAKFIDNKK